MPERTNHLDAVLAQAAQRASLRGALRGAFLGVIVLLAWLALSLFSEGVATWSHTLAGKVLPLLATIAVSAVVGWWRVARAREEPARILEPLVPASNNLLVTAHELQRAETRATGTHAVPSDVKAMVLQRAEQLAAKVDVASLIPVRPAGMRLDRVAPP